MLAQADCRWPLPREVKLYEGHLLEQFPEGLFFIEKGKIMKTNAIIIASIMFVAGTAASRADDQSKYESSSTPPVSSQYDPASGSYGTSVSGSGYSSDQNTSTSGGNFHADSSVRGGSNEARGVARSGLDSEGPAQSLNPSMQADSSIRGGWRQAHQPRNWDQPPSSSTHRELRREFKADSSIRGGSNEARYPYRFYEEQNREDFGQSSSESWPSDKEGSLSGSANWNPSDDLMPDGTLSSGINNDASVGGPASSSTDSASSSAPLDDMTEPSVPDKDLNSSDHLEKNLSGEYNIEDQTDTGLETGNTLSADIPSDGSFQNDSIGGPGSVQTGVNSSSDSGEDSTVIDTSEQGNAAGTSGIYLFHNNRAQGVGSAATGESGSASSSSTLNRSEDPLAQRVKSTLTRESTGTHGMMRHEVARNIQVSSHGGTVVLKGTVPSQKDKDMIEIRAREISGVQRVDNQLTVTPEADPAVRNLSTGHDLEDTTDELQKFDQDQY
jgi:osmotically-inducible protein OsmY